MARSSGRVVGAAEDKVAEGGGAEDEELGETGALGFGLSPGAEAGLEGELGGGQGGGRWWRYDYESLQ